MVAKIVNPLTYNEPITDAFGRPTPEFQRKWAQQNQVNASIPTDYVNIANLTMPPEFLVTVKPLAGGGYSLVVTKAKEAKNTVWAGPASGSNAAPAFRAIVPADLPIATTSALGAVKPDGTTITITAGGVISAAGGGGSFYSWPPTTGQGGYNTSAHASKGNAFIPLKTFTLDKVFAMINATNGDIYAALLCTIDNTGKILTTVATSATFTAVATQAHTAEFDFSGAETCIAGTIYALVIVLTNRTTTTSCNLMYQGTPCQILPGIAEDYAAEAANFGQVGYIYVWDQNSTAPAAVAANGSTGSAFAIGAHVTP